MDDFELELKNIFLDEAAQAIGDVELAFINLEENPQDSATIDKIFRLAHNLKGSSRAVGFLQMGEFTHHLESLLLNLKNKELGVTPSIISLLLQCTDFLNKMVSELRNDFNKSFSIDEYIEKLTSIKLEEIKAIESSPTAIQTSTQIPPADGQWEDITADPSSDKTMFVPFASATTESLAPMSAQLNVSEAPRKTQKPQQKSTQGQKDETLRVSIDRLEKLVNSVSELAIYQTVLKEQLKESDDKHLHQTVHQLEKMIKDIQDISMNLRMVPIKPLFQKMLRIVRDTTTALGKSAELKLTGEDTEIDKSVFELIGDPLVHLIRNACDHGIEDPQTRTNQGKTPQGTVDLKAFHRGDQLVIEITDDGKGIDTSRVRQLAIQRRIIRDTDQLTEKQLQMLIFHAGFSTKEQVTDISGRGVGMDVVKTNIESLGGTLSLESHLGQGTTVEITLPLTLAIIDGFVISSGQQKFVVPKNIVEEAVRVDSTNRIETRSGAGEMFYLRGETYPLQRLSQITGNQSVDDVGTILMVNYKKELVAFHIDRIQTLQSVVVKKLGPEARHIYYAFGATILGDGKPCLILDINEILQRRFAA